MEDLMLKLFALMFCLAAALTLAACGSLGLSNPTDDRALVKQVRLSPVHVAAGDEVEVVLSLYVPFPGNYYGLDLDYAASGGNLSGQQAERDGRFDSHYTLKPVSGQRITAIEKGVRWRLPEAPGTYSLRVSLDGSSQSLKVQVEP
jgi:hypothetical protein